MELSEAVTVEVLLIGVMVLGALALGAGLKKVGVPALVGYIALGLGLRILNDRYGLLAESGLAVLDFLARAGIIALLFRIGLESNVKRLASQLRGASTIWLSNVVVSGAVGFATTHLILGYDLIPSLVVATALTATSIGISSAIWEERDLLDTDEGASFLDVAELDDISAVVLMALLFATLSDFRAGTIDLVSIAGTLGWFIVKLAIFGAACLMFALFVEERLTRWVERIRVPQAPTVIGIAFVIAAFAAMLGFSEAIGAFLAGLAFSRDPDLVKIDASFGPLHDLLAPFFFIGVGVAIPPKFLLLGVVPGLVLAVAAIVGKVGGTAIPSLPGFGVFGALLIGVSMVPRAEITMVVLQRAQHLGEWAAPNDLFSAMVLVSLITSIGGSLVLPRMLKRRFG